MEDSSLHLNSGASLVSWATWPVESRTTTGLRGTFLRIRKSHRLWVTPASQVCREASIYYLSVMEETPLHLSSCGPAKAGFHLSLTRIYKELLQLSNRKANNKRWTRSENRHFSKENVQVANKHMRKCSISLAFKEVQCKTPMRGLPW